MRQQFTRLVNKEQNIFHVLALTVWRRYSLYSEEIKSIGKADTCSLKTWAPSILPIVGHMLLSNVTCCSSHQETWSTSRHYE